MTVLGKYTHYNTLFHRLDPRTKLLSLIIMVIAILATTKLNVYLFLIVVVFSALITAKIFRNSIINIYKSLLFMGLMLLVFNVILIKTGSVLFVVANISVHQNAIAQTVFVWMRLVMLLSLSTLLTATTKPLDLSLGLEKSMLPLKKWRVPVNEIALIISISLRFIPVFATEAQKIMKAQTARGIDFEKGKLNEKMRGIVALLVPLFVSAFQKATDLANAMEVRGYSTTKPRTKYRILKMNKNDWLFLIVVLLILLVALGIQYAL